MFKKHKIECEIAGCKKPAEVIVTEYDGDGPETFDMPLCR